MAETIPASEAFTRPHVLPKVKTGMRLWPLGITLLLVLLVTSCSNATEPRLAGAGATASPTGGSDPATSGFTLTINPIGCPWAPRSVSLQDVNTGETVAVGHQIGWTKYGAKFRFVETPSVLFNVVAYWSAFDSGQPDIQDSWGPYDQLNATNMPILDQNPGDFPPDCGGSAD
jgi:hypothetical protein